MIDVPLSVLDLSPVAAGTTASQALQHTTELARRTEELGYHRFWVAEHHNMPAIASSAPAVLIAHLAAATSTIRVGSGGVMLPNHAPLVVAEQFGTLEALHPGRIDLGIGRAPGTDQLTALALRRTMEGLSAEDFPQELADLIGLFSGEVFTGGGLFAGQPGLRPGHHRDPGPGRHARDLAARLQRVQRPAGRPARPAVLFRAPLQRGQHGARAGPVPAVLPALGSGCSSRTRWSR